MNHQDRPAGGSKSTLNLFPEETEWAHTRVLHSQAIKIEDFDLDQFAEYRTIRILTYSSSLQMLHTLLKRCVEANIECVLGHAERVHDLAAVVAVQTATTEEVHKALRKLPQAARERVAERIREGHLTVRVVEGHVSHAKIYLLSNGPGNGRCVLTGSANFSTSALLGDQHEVLTRYTDDLAWKHFEGEYVKVRHHSSAEIPVGTLCEQRLDPNGRYDPEAAPVLAPGRAAQVIQLAHPAEPEEGAERGRRVREVYDIVLPMVRKGPKPAADGTLRMNAATRSKFSGLIRRETQRRKATHPTFSLDLAASHATLCGEQWTLESSPEAESEDAKSLVGFWDSYRSAFRGRTEKLQRDYFIFLCWMFFSPLMCTLRREAALEAEDVVRFPKVGVIYGKANSGKTQLIAMLGQFMFADSFGGAIRSVLTGQTLRGIETAYRRMPAFFDDVGRARFREHAHEYIKNETLCEHEEAPCTIMSMNAKAGVFPEEITKRCLLIYAAASLPGDQENKRIAMSNQLARVKPTTHLYRAYLRETIERMRGQTAGLDWLEVSSQIVAGLLRKHGHEPEWAQTVTWEAYAATRYEAVREQLRSVLDATRRRSGRFGPNDVGWRVENDKIRVRVRTNTHGHPEFNWRELPTYMLNENESRGGEFVLVTKAVETFLGHKVTPPRWRLPLLSRSA